MWKLLRSVVDSADRQTSVAKKLSKLGPEDTNEASQLTCDLLDAKPKLLDDYLQNNPIN